MNFTNRTVVSIAVAAALFGGSAGAFINRSISTAPEAASQPAAAPTSMPAAPTPLTAEPLSERTKLIESPHELIDEAEAPEMEPEPVAVARAPKQSKRSRASSRAPRRSYYNYSEPAARASYEPQRVQRSAYQYPERRSFWKRHRDLLTVGIGTGVGAAVGGMAGGKKGALIGAAAGGGGSALWTYKLRNRNNDRD